MERIGIYGGTFAPVHKGHTKAATEFLSQLKLDKLLIIPALIPPHKQLDFADNPLHRLNMCKIAFSNFEKTEVSEIELQRNGKSYTYDTLLALSAPERKLFLLCGTDMILTFEEWHRFRDIFNICTLVYANRSVNTKTEAQTKAMIKHLKDNYCADIITLDYMPFEVSSTEIRLRISKNENVSNLIDKNVYNYIIENNLYK